MELDVKLYPHKGMQQVAIGGKIEKVEVELDQCIVHVNGQQVGYYCGKIDQPNKFLAFIVHFPEVVRQKIADKVAEITGGVGTQKSVAPPVHEFIDEGGDE